MRRVCSLGAAVVLCSQLACSATNGDGSGSERLSRGNMGAGGADNSGGSAGEDATGRGGASTGNGDIVIEAPDEEVEKPTPELWYASGDLLVYIELSREDGSVVRVAHSQLDLPEEQFKGQNSITMLGDGSLLGVRLSNQSYLYHIPDPPRDGSPATIVQLGVTAPELEALYTDCEDRVYAMDTGEDRTFKAGNRLLLFSGNVLERDFTLKPVSDLSEADVADIDDMSPGVDANGQITDNPGLAIDTGSIYEFNYETGRGERVGNGGTFGIHVLGGSLFDDGRARVYLLSRNAELLEIDPTTWELSQPLVTGPQPSYGQFRGHSGLAGPLTACETGFVHDIR